MSKFTDAALLFHSYLLLSSLYIIHYTHLIYVINTYAPNKRIHLISTHLCCCMLKPYINLMATKSLILLVLLSVALSYNYPLYKQCDGAWGNDKLGTSAKTICQAGCLMSSAAMALTGFGKSYNPHTLNIWLNANGGYASGNLFVWGSINKLGFNFKGFIGNGDIKKNLDAGNVVICNVHNGGHWVLAKGYSGDNILVNDPGYATTSYPLSGIVSGNTGLYTVNRSPKTFSEMWSSMGIFFDEVFGFTKYSPEPAVQVPIQDQLNIINE